MCDVIINILIEFTHIMIQKIKSLFLPLSLCDIIQKNLLCLMLFRKIYEEYLLTYFNDVIFSDM